MDSYANDLVKVMQTSLTKHEFASALDMKPSDTFVTKMFRVVDQDGDGRISFQVIFIIVYLHILSNTSIHSCGMVAITSIICTFFRNFWIP